MEWDLRQCEIISDGNPTFMIEDPMKKVHMGNNKSFANPPSTKKMFLPMVWLWCWNVEFERMSNTLNNFISLMGNTYKCSMHLMKSPI